MGIQDFGHGEESCGKTLLPRTDTLVGMGLDMYKSKNSSANDHRIAESGRLKWERPALKRLQATDAKQRDAKGGDARNHESS